MKSCTRCGRTGSHAFRRTPDGLYECSTITACRTRARRAKAATSGAVRGGRGHPPGSRAAIGVAYVIGEAGELREVVAGTLRESTGYSVAVGGPDRGTLVAIGLRNVQLIAVDASCLSRVGFRNEFALRRGESQLRSVPVIVYGREGEVSDPAPADPRVWQITYRRHPQEVTHPLTRCVTRASAQRASAALPSAAAD